MYLKFNVTVVDLFLSYGRTKEPWIWLSISVAIL